MFRVICLFLFIYIFIFIKKNKIRIKFRTFFKKGFKVDTGAYGVYCYCGKQGSGKTYSVIEYLFENSDKKIYANVASIQDLDYTYISNFDDLLKIENDTGENIIIFYDEIFSALTKQDKMSKEVLSFLSQMRKRKIIFLTTAQEWLEINVTLRRYVRFQINCKILSIPFINKSFLLKVFHDGDQIHWDNLENDYVSPIIESTFSKMSLKIAESYDTYETIKSTNDRKPKKIENNKKLVELQKPESSGFWNSNNPRGTGGEPPATKSLDTTTSSDLVVNGQTQDFDFWDKERIDFNYYE